MVLSRLDFPLPVLPMRYVNSPSPISRLMFRRMVLPSAWRISADDIFTIEGTMLGGFIFRGEIQVFGNLFKVNRHNFRPIIAFFLFFYKNLKISTEHCSRNNGVFAFCGLNIRYFSIIFA